MTSWFRRLRARIRYRRFETDVARELEVHREMKQAELESGGLPAAAARHQSALEMGNVTLMREEARGVWIAPWLQSVWQDVRYAGSTFARQPIFSLSAMTVLALGIGLVTALFTFVNAALLRPWRVPDPDSMVVIRPRPAGLSEYGGVSIAEYRHLRERVTSLSHLIASVRASARVAYGPGDEFEDVRAAYVSDNYFDALRIGMAAGRGFRADEGDYGAPKAVAILSERLWRERFGRDPSLIGRVLRLRGQPFTIVGVAARGFVDVHGSHYEVWLPLAAQAIGAAGQGIAQFSDPRQQGGVEVGGRLSPGVSHAEAAAELEVLSHQFRSAASLPRIGLIVTDTRPVSAGRSWRRQLPLLTLLFGALFLVQLLACANVGNLLLARALSRRREIAIRLSLGASRARVVRQLVTEAVVLSFGAGAIGFGLAFAMPPLVLRFIEDPPERAAFFAPDLLVFQFAQPVRSGRVSSDHRDPGRIGRPRHMDPRTTGVAGRCRHHPSGGLRFVDRSAP